MPKKKDKDILGGRGLVIWDRYLGNTLTEGGWVAFRDDIGALLHRWTWRWRNNDKFLLWWLGKAKYVCSKGGRGMIGVQPVREPPYHPDNDNPAITEINISVPNLVIYPKKIKFHKQRPSVPFPPPFFPHPPPLNRPSRRKWNSEKKAGIEN